MTQTKISVIIVLELSIFAKKKKKMTFILIIMKGRKTMKHFKPMACILSSVVLLAAMSWSVFADDEPQAKIGDTTYSTFAEAAKAAKAGDTVTLLTDIENSGDINFKEAVTVDGDSHTISGNSCIKLPADGGTITNIKFENIHNSNSKLSPVYATSLKGTLTVTNCTFSEVDWDAIQSIPSSGAEFIIKNNTFEEKDSAVIAQRFIHIESNIHTDFSATITGNKLYGSTKQGTMEVYYFEYPDKVELSGNYIQDISNVCILNGNTFNLSSKIFPTCLDPDTMVADYSPVAEIKGIYTSTFYDSFADAVAAAKAGNIIYILVDEIDFTPIKSINYLTIMGNGAVVKNIPQNCFEGTTKRLIIDGFVFENDNDNNFNIKGEDFIVQNCTFKGTNGLRQSTVTGNCQIINCDFDTKTYGIHVGFGNGTLNVKNSTIRGFNTFATNTTTNFSNCKYVASERGNKYTVCQTWGKMTIKDSSFDKAWSTNYDKKSATVVTTQNATAVADIINCTTDGGSIEDMLTVNGTYSQPGVVSVDATKDADGKYISGTILGENKDSYIADGFEAVDNENGTYTVTEKPAKVEITATDAYVDENSGLGNLRYITTATVGENATVEYFGTWFIPYDIFTNDSSSLNVTVQKNEAITSGQTYSADLLSIPASELERKIIGVSFIKLSGRDDIISSAQKITTVTESEAK